MLVALPYSRAKRQRSKACGNLVATRDGRTAQGQSAGDDGGNRVAGIGRETGGGGAGDDNGSGDEGRDSSPG